VAKWSTATARRSRARSVVALICVGLVTALSSGASVSSAAGPGRAALGRAGLLRRAFGSQVRIGVRPDTGRITFLAAGVGRTLATAQDDGDPSTTARQFIDRYGSAFGVDSPAADLTETRRSTGATGVAIRFQQTHRGLPVFAGELAVQVDAQGDVASVTGEASPDLGIDVDHPISAAAAAATALAVTRKADGTQGDQIITSAPEAWIYDPSLLGAGDGGPRVVWKVQVRDALGGIDRLVLVDAHTGGVALTFSNREDVANRQICNNVDLRGFSETCLAPVRTEATGPYPNVGVGASDVNSAFDLAGVVYDFYMGMFGRDSVDGQGLPLKATVAYCPPYGQGNCPYDNAFWNGQQMVYGLGYASADDVVGHELTHGVTQYTSGLLYYAESGAIDESMSDVMGELIDLGSTTSGPDLPGDRWKIGEQLAGGPVRDMAHPENNGDPDRMTSPLFWGSAADNHGVHTNSGVGNKAATLIADGGTFNGQTMNGLGLDKTARIYYQAETTLLGPGSDYLDLFSILPQACTALTGSHGITADDCAQVVKAVTATQMNQAPTAAGAKLTALMCPAGSTPNTALFSDDMEVDDARWTGNAPSQAAAWRYFSGSSQSGVRSLHADDLGTAADARVAMTAPVAVATAGTYLYFSHSFDLEADGNGAYDGGVVEYSTGGAAGPWLDAGTLPGTLNGYTATLATGGGNALGGRRAFSGTSPGYEQTRIDLGTLAGRSVSIRFRLGSDISVSAAGWFIDDVSIYACEIAPAGASPGSSPVAGVFAVGDGGAPALRFPDVHPG
jgi:bacillolysin